jgi:hypothetical protein
VYDRKQSKCKKKDPRARANDPGAEYRRLDRFFRNMTEEEEEKLMEEYLPIIMNRLGPQMTIREARDAVAQFRDVMENNDEGARLPVNVLVPRKKK